MWACTSSFSSKMVSYSQLRHQHPQRCPLHEMAPNGGPELTLFKTLISTKSQHLSFVRNVIFFKGSGYHVMTLLRPLSKFIELRSKAELFVRMISARLSVPYLVKQEGF